MQKLALRIPVQRSLELVQLRAGVEEPGLRVRLSPVQPSAFVLPCRPRSLREYAAWLLFLLAFPYGALLLPSAVPFS